MQTTKNSSMSGKRKRVINLSPSYYTIYNCIGGLKQDVPYGHKHLHNQVAVKQSAVCHSCRYKVNISRLYEFFVSWGRAGPQRRWQHLFGGSTCLQVQVGCCATDARYNRRARRLQLQGRSMSSFYIVG
jgi:hypothetical protein